MPKYLCIANARAAARWFPAGELARTETQIFEDHLHVMARFIEVW